MIRPSDRRARRLRAGALGGAIALAVAGLAACGAPPPEITTILIPTAPPGDACLDALVGGRLVASERWGLALETTPGQVSKVLWPNGYRGVREGERIALVDASGRVVAEVGATIRAGGGFVGPNGDPDHTILVCGEIRVEGQ